MPVDDSSSTMNANITISPSAPSRTSYRFLGWCNAIPTTTDGTDTCSGTTYQPNATYTLDQTSGSNNISLTAMWQVIYMQDLTPSTIASLLPNEHSTAIVRDKRDNQEYTIAKLKDGKYWMTENLNLAGGTALSANDTDVASAYISSFTTSNNLTKSGDTIVLPASSTSGFNSDNYSFVYNSGNKTNCGASGQDTPCYSYYSWDAATLGSGRTIATDNTDAEQSICPKGWRLPTSGATSSEGWKRGDFYALATAYDANLESNYYDTSSATGANFYNNAGPGTIPGFLLAGYYSYGSFGEGGSYGYYWSSTSSASTSGARDLTFNSSYVYSANVVGRFLGSGVRCLFSGQ